MIPKLSLFSASNKIKIHQQKLTIGKDSDKLKENLRALSQPSDNEKNGHVHVLSFSSLTCKITAKYFLCSFPKSLERVK